MGDLRLIKTERFDSINCDFFETDKEEICMTREQIGYALGYALPSRAIGNIHDRHKDRIDQYSGMLKLSTPGGLQNTMVYTAKGIYEICRWSQQSKANKFMDWVWDVVEKIRKNGIIPSNVNSYMVMTEEDRAIAYFQQVKQRKLLEEENKEMLPKVESYNDFMDAYNCLTMKQVANSLFHGKGRNKLFKFLREHKVLTKHNIPYQNHIDAGRFIVKNTTINMNKDDDTENKTKAISQTFVTPKGVEYISKLCKDKGFTA